MRLKLIPMLGVSAVAVLAVSLAVAGLTWVDRTPSTVGVDPDAHGTVDDSHPAGLTAPRRADSEPEVPQTGIRAQEELQAVVARLRAAQAQAIQPVPDDQPGSETLADRLADLGNEGVPVRLLARQCRPAPCVTAVEITGRGEAAQTARDSFFMAAVEAAQDEDAQPTMSWTEGEDVAIGYVWFVPNDVTPEASEALLTAAMANKSAIGG